MDKKHLKGFESEMEAELWLTKLGYIVYTKKGVQSPIDFLCYHPGRHELLLVDVKSASYRKTGKKKGSVIYRSPSNIQKKMGVSILYVLEDGSCTLQSPILKE
jgi:hypothetical protein|tara:strand:+ start:332 stop:640 length:309 start_codon:yes stop_codon:yes gene_type:complete